MIKLYLRKGKVKLKIKKRKEKKKEEIKRKENERKGKKWNDKGEVNKMKWGNEIK